MRDRLSLAMKSISDTLIGIPGINLVTDNPPEHLAPSDFPAVLVMPGEGNSRPDSPEGENGYPTRISNYVVMIDLHINRADHELGDAIEISRNLLNPIVNELFKEFKNSRFNGGVDFLGDPKSPGGFPISYRFANLGWGTLETLGYRFRVDISVVEDIV